MNPRIRPRMPASIGSNQVSPANSPAPSASVVLPCSMAWSPPARQRRSWLVEQGGGYATPRFHHLRDGTSASTAPMVSIWHNEKARLADFHISATALETTAGI